MNIKKLSLAIGVFIGINAIILWVACYQIVGIKHEHLYVFGFVAMVYFVIRATYGIGRIDGRGEPVLAKDAFGKRAMFWVGAVISDDTAVCYLTPGRPMLVKFNLKTTWRLRQHWHYIWSEGKPTSAWT